MRKLNLFKILITLIFIASISTFWMMRGSITNLAKKFVNEQHSQWYIRERKPKRMLVFVNSGQTQVFIKNHFYVKSFKDLETGFYEDAQSYQDRWYIYLIRSNNRAAFIYIFPKKQNLNSYVGVVFAVFDANKKLKLLSIGCKTKSAGIIKPAEPRYQDGQLVCGEGTDTMFREQTLVR